MRNCNKIELNQYKYDVFISYSHSCDRNKLNYILTALKSKGLKVCLDERSFVSGEPILNEIVTALERSKLTLTLIDKDYLKKPWCLGEFFIGSAFKAIKPILLEKISFQKLPYNLDARICSSFDDLIKDTDQLEKFLSDTVNQCKNKMLRTTFDDSLLINSGTSIQSLKSLRAEFPRSHLCINKVQEACDFFGNHADEEYRTAFAQYSHPDYITTGLANLHSLIFQADASSNNWKHLATLSEPFNYAIFKACTEKINAPNTPQNTQSVPAQRLRNYRRKAPKIPDSWKQTISGIKIETPNFQFPEWYKPSIKLSSLLRRTTKLLSYEKQHPLPARKYKAVNSPSLLTSVSIQKPFSIVRKTTARKVKYILAVLRSRYRTAHLRTLLPIALFSALLSTASFIPLAAPPHTTKKIPPSVKIPEEAPTSTETTETTETALPKYCSTHNNCSFEQGATLYQISKECFGSGNNWDVIWKINPTIRNPDLVFAGQNFIVPQTCRPSSIK